jgi:hypothetical protein
VSRARAKADRNPDDLYVTPRECAETLIQTIPLKPDWRILEPSAGDGAWLRALAIHPGFGGRVDCVEIRPEAEEPLRELYLELGLVGEVYVADFTAVTRRLVPGGYDLTVGNMPYSLGREFIRHMLFHTRRNGVVANLLRQGILHTQGRRRFNRAHPCWLNYRLDERPPFANDSTDSAEYGWLLWRKGHRGRTLERNLSWTDDSPCRTRDLELVRAEDWPLWSAV